MSELKGNLVEYKNICVEIKRLSKLLKDLKKKKEKLEGNVVTNLDSKKEKGVKYKGQVYLTENKKGRKRKTKIEKQIDAENVLKKYGISNSEKIYKELVEAMRGHEIDKAQLKLKK